MVTYQFKAIFANLSHSARVRENETANFFKPLKMASITMGE